MEIDVDSLIYRMLALHEGVRREPYQCSKGRWTIGIGRNFQDNPFTAWERHVLGGLPEKFSEQKTYLFGNPLSTMQVRWLFESTLKAVMDSLRKNAQLSKAYDRADPVRQAVLVDMLFNMGLATFSKFTHFLAAMKIGNYTTAANEMVNSTWYRQVGSRAVRLTRIMRTGLVPKELEEKH